MTRRFGWIRDLPDKRDFYMMIRPAARLPKRVDLREVSRFPPVYDQGDIGSCTAQAIAAAHCYEQIRQDAAPMDPSRLFIYWNERAMEGTTTVDAGAYIRDGMKVVDKLGVCHEGNCRGGWPYITKKFARRPPVACYLEARRWQVLKYSRLNQSLDQMRACLAGGHPFVFGFTVYESFMSAAVARTGVAELPSISESVLGGHAVLAIGYDDASQRFLVRNSWGEDWGQKGHFTMPYHYLTHVDLAADFWTMSLVEAPKGKGR